MTHMAKTPIKRALPRGAQKRIAQECGCSQAYVSRALDSERPDTDVEIKKAAARLARPRRAFAAWFPGVTP